MNQGWGGLEVQVIGGSSTGPTPKVVVLLHGWGAPGDDLVPLARELARPDTRFVVPAAPLPRPGGGLAWWPLDLDRRQRALARGQDIAAEVPEGLPAARTRVQALLKEVRTRYRPEVLILAGFSQGGMLALDVALAADPPVDRVAVLSGTLIAENLWRGWMAREKKPPVFMSHGRGDPILPFVTSERLRSLLAEHGFSVTWVPFEGGHEIPEVVLERAARVPGPLTARPSAAREKAPSKVSRSWRIERAAVPSWFRPHISSDPLTVTWTARAIAAVSVPAGSSPWVTAWSRIDRSSAVVARAWADTFFCRPGSVKSSCSQDRWWANAAGVAPMAAIPSP